MAPHYVFNAVSGDCICVLPLTVGDALDVDTLSQFAQHDLRGYKVITERAEEPLQELDALVINIIDNGETQLVRGNPHDYLFNKRLSPSWEDWGSPGWRRWYKEFTVFAQRVPMHPGESEWLHNPGNYCLQSRTVRSLVPAILQAMAAESRGARYGKVPFARGFGTAPFIQSNGGLTFQ